MLRRPFGTGVEFLEMENQSGRDTEIILALVVKVRMNVINLNRPEGEKLVHMNVDSSAEALRQ